jgi:hypothetical protein
MIYKGNPVEKNGKKNWSARYFPFSGNKVRLNKAKVSKTAGIHNHLIFILFAE